MSERGGRRLGRRRALARPITTIRAGVSACSSLRTPKVRSPVLPLQKGVSGLVMGRSGLGVAADHRGRGDVAIRGRALRKPVSSCREAWSRPPAGILGFPWGTAEGRVAVGSEVGPCPQRTWRSEALGVRGPRRGRGCSGRRCCVRASHGGLLPHRFGGGLRFENGLGVGRRSWLTGRSVFHRCPRVAVAHEGRVPRPDNLSASGVALGGAHEGGPPPSRHYCHLARSAAGDDPGDAGGEGAEVVGVDPVGVLEAEGAHAGGARRVELVGSFRSSHCAGAGDDGVGVSQAVGDEGGGGVEEAVASGGVVVAAFDGLGGEHDAGVAAGRRTRRPAAARRPSRRVFSAPNRRSERGGMSRRAGAK